MFFYAGELCEKSDAVQSAENHIDKTEAEKTTSTIKGVFANAIYQSLVSDKRYGIGSKKYGRRSSVNSIINN